MAQEKLASCFVIGPIGDELAPYGDPERARYEHALEIWEKVIEPACLVAGIEPTRADKIARAGEITEQVFRQVRDADLVIADVTGGNANVMYELGLRHTLHKATIQIGEHGQLPFDISAIRTLRFARTPAGLVDARKNLAAAISAALAGNFDAVTATRLWNPTITIVAESQAANAPIDDVADDNEPGVFELLSEMESALPELTALSERATQSMATLGILATAATADIQKSDTMKAGFAGRLRITNNLAADLSPIADELESVADGFEQSLARVDSGMKCLLDIAEQDHEQAKELHGFTNVMQVFAGNSRTVSAQLSSFVGSLSVPGKFSKAMRVSARRIAEATQRIIKALAIAEIWSARMERLVAPSSGSPLAE